MTLLPHAKGENAGPDPDRFTRPAGGPEQNPKIEAAFKEGGNKDVTARVLPDLNHLSYTTPTVSRLTTQSFRRR
jgi:hypothetical protein